MPAQDAAWRREHPLRGTMRRIGQDFREDMAAAKHDAKHETFATTHAHINQTFKKRRDAQKEERKAFLERFWEQQGANKKSPVVPTNASSAEAGKANQEPHGPEPYTRTIAQQEWFDE